MQYSEENGTTIVKLDSGESIIPALETICSESSVDSGTVVWGIGRLRNTEIGYLKGKNYEKRIVENHAEVVSFHGSIADSTPKLHVHVGLALRDHSIVGGHLFGGTVDPMMEIQVLRLRSVYLTRAVNPRNGLNELKVTGETGKKTH